MNSLSLLVGGSPPSLTLLASSTMSSLDPSVGKHLLYSSPCGCKYVHNINVIIETQKNIMFTFFNWIGGGGSRNSCKPVFNLFALLFLRVLLMNVSTLHCHNSKLVGWWDTHGSCSYCRKRIICFQ